MKDIPVFTTEHGAASLVLREIPHRGEAYIRLHSSREPEKLLQECVAFCRACGAERVYTAGESVPEGLPMHCHIYQMRGTAWVDPQLLENLFPVTQQTVGRWREIYKTRMARVDNVASLSYLEEAGIVSSGGAYFVHSGGQLLGIGWLEDTKLLAMAAVKPGAGERVMHSLMSLIEGSTMTLEVASTNQKALELYRGLGILPVGEISRWYDVGGKVL